MSAARRTAAAAPGGGAATVSVVGFGSGNSDLVPGILIDTPRSPAISALALGLLIYFFARADQVYARFYEPLFRGLLSVLMLIMGMEAWARLSKLRKVAYAHIRYGLIAPIVHGMMGSALGMLAHHLTGFSAVGVVLLAVMAASSSDISARPTLRAALPEANPSAYLGTSTSLGTPFAILSIPLFMALAEKMIGFGLSCCAYFSERHAYWSFSQCPT
ncbi:MAG: sodium-dependent bicarbonate transport family permease [Pseudomonadota bacterium]